jgi:hypothetical protein
VKFLGEAPVAFEQVRPQAVDLHLLDVLVVGEDVLEVEQLSRLGRAPVAEAEGDLREAHLGQRRRHRGGEQEHDP